MMKVLLVDDERLALIHLQMMLEEIGGIEVAGTFSDPVLAVEQAKLLQPDVVFLDIQMHDMDGLMTAAQLQEDCPKAEIVFVTAYDQYAVHAFELQALDYIMKPLQPERLRRTVQRLKELLKQEANDKGPAQPQICCMHQIQVQLPGEKPEMIKWRTAKAQELFAYLLHHQGKLIGRDDLLELLWTDFDTSRGSTQLYTTIYHIRQSLKRCKLTGVSITRGSLIDGYRLDLGEVAVDTYEWERQLKQLEAIHSGNYAQHQYVLDLYRGDYLGEYGYLWAEYERERLRRLCLQHAQTVSEYYIRESMLSAAIEVNHKIQQLLPFQEESYLSLMQLYASQQQAAAVEEQYWLLTSRFEQELEAPPSDEVRLWYERWKQAATST